MVDGETSVHSQSCVDMWIWTALKISEKYTNVLEEVLLLLFLLLLQRPHLLPFLLIPCFQRFDFLTVGLYSFYLCAHMG